jgi:hypothetical protein
VVVVVVVSPDPELPEVPPSELPPTEPPLPELPPSELPPPEPDVVVVVVRMVVMVLPPSLDPDPPPSLEPLPPSLEDAVVADGPPGDPESMPLPSLDPEVGEGPPGEPSPAPGPSATPGPVGSAPSRRVRPEASPRWSLTAALKPRPLVSATRVTPPRTLGRAWATVAATAECPWLRWAECECE